MTHLQKRIRDVVQQHGHCYVTTGRTKCANMNTINALKRSGYRCLIVWHGKDEFGNDSKTFKIVLRETA